MHTERENLAPIAGGSHVVPGPVRGHVPQPTEIVCIEAKKVFDFCFQQHRVEKEFNLDKFKEESVSWDEIEVECEIEEDDITCREVGKREEVEGQKGKFVVCVAVNVPVTIKLVKKDCEKVLACFQKTVTVRIGADAKGRPGLQGATLILR